MTRAADRLHYSVSTISRLIANLEQSTGATLVTRQEGRTWLTPAGVRKVSVACAILCAAQEMDGDPDDGQDGRQCTAAPSLPCVGYHDCVGRQGPQVRPDVPVGGRPLNASWRVLPRSPQGP